MKIRILFYTFLIFTVSAFFWWAYSLISLSMQKGLHEISLLNGRVHQAEAQFYKLGDKLHHAPQNMEFVLRGTEISMHREMFMAIEKEYPKLDFILQNGTLEIVPKAEVVEEIENRTRNKYMAYFYEGLVFLILLVLCFTWIYRSLHSTIALKQNQSNFLLSVTHELKTPIASVKLFLQTIMMRELSRDQLMKLAQNSVDDTDRLNDLVENLLLATRIEGKSYHYDYKQHDLSVLVKEIADNYERHYGKKYSFITDIEENIWMKADEFSLRLVVTNLLENAMKYSPKGSVVQAKVYKSGEQVIISVIDAGMGIPLKERKKIFTKFYRIGNESTRSAKGTGLGLFIVKQVVENHNGIIEVENNLPKGTIFTIKFWSK